MTDLTPEGRERLKEAAADVGRHKRYCGYNDVTIRNGMAVPSCECGLTEFRNAVPDLLDALEAVEAERDALRASVKSTEEDLYERAAEAESLRAALADAVAHCPSCGGRLRFKLRTCKGWEDRPCQRCKPWREALQL